jgi:hypothetical protein
MARETGFVMGRLRNPAARRLKGVLKDLNRAMSAKGDRLQAFLCKRMKG